MVKSMTGFGKGEAALQNKKITVEIRSLNSKQLDLGLRLPAVYRQSEYEIRNIIARTIQRGKVDVFVTVEDKGAEEYRPSGLHNFSMYLDGRWYSLTAKPGTYDDNDPIGVLDVTVLSNLVLDRILDIKDLRTSKRIDFVGGIRGLGELKRRVDSGEMKAAFALYPVSMQQLINIADTGNIMPPKTTWFEPKLRSGVVIHSFEE